jgi:uncharacterized protein (TIGR04255 family)
LQTFGALVRKQLPNSPLVEVAFEVRFPGHFDVYAGLARFQHAIGERFSQLFVPLTDSGEAPALKPYRFALQDGSETVAVAINQLSYSTRTYTVFAEFVERVRAVTDTFFDEVYRPPHFTRIGLRYINALPWFAPKASQLHPWLKFGLATSALLDRRVEACNIETLLAFEEGSLMLRCARAGLGPEGHSTEGPLVESFMLDLDFFRMEPTPASELGAFLEAAHGVIDEAFFGMVTSDGRVAMEGG